MNDHGPGSSGGASFGNEYDFGAPVYNDYHTFTVEWQPGRIDWYVDGRRFQTVGPGDLSGEWVFDRPFFILLNVAVGGRWVGAPDEHTVFPQTMLVDWVRVYGTRP